MINYITKYSKVLLITLFSVFFIFNLVQADATATFSVDSVLQGAVEQNPGYQQSGSVPTTYPLIVGRFISVFLSVLGVIFVGQMIYAGYLWFMARGDEQMVTKAKQIIEHAIVGLIIVVLAYALTEFLLKAFGSKFTNGTTGY